MRGVSASDPLDLLVDVARIFLRHAEGARLAYDSSCRKQGSLFHGSYERSVGRAFGGAIIARMDDGSAIEAARDRLLERVATERLRVRSSDRYTGISKKI